MLASKYTVDAAKSLSLSGIKLVLAIASDYATVQNGAEFFAKGGGRATYCADLATRSGLSRKSVDNKSALASRVLADWTDRVSASLIDGTVTAASVNALADGMRDTLKREGYGFNEDDVSRYFGANGRTESRKAERDRKEKEAAAAVQARADKLEADKARAAEQAADKGQPQMGDKLQADMAAPDTAPAAEVTPGMVAQPTPGEPTAVIGIVGSITYTMRADGVGAIDFKGSIDRDDVETMIEALQGRLAEMLATEALAKAA